MDLQHEASNNNHNQERVDLDNIPSGTNIPILGINRDTFVENPKEVFQFAIVYATDMYPKQNNVEIEDRLLNDFNNGIPHFHIGLNTGPVKQITFTKNDQPYIKEARYFRDGFDGLTQLREPYNVNITLFGNSRIFPGTLVWIDPTGLGPGTIGMPYDKKSLAWTFGFGGYHLVTDVKHTITSNSYETHVTAKFVYRGAPGAPRSDGSNTNDEEATNCAVSGDPFFTEAKVYSEERKAALNAQLDSYNVSGPAITEDVSDYTGVETIPFGTGKL